MRKRNAFHAMLASFAVALLACDDESVTAPDADISEIRAPRAAVQQVDRIGLPAINTALVANGADKDRFNQTAPVDDEALFTAIVIETIQARFGLSDDAAAGLTDFVLPDMLPLGDLGGFPAGRRLDDDVIDTVLGLIFGVFGPPAPGLQSDGVDGNDVPFSNRFPYLGSPQAS